VAQAVAQRASGVSRSAAAKATEKGNIFTEGKRKGDRAQAVAQFKEKFKNADTNTKHQMVKQIMGKKFGGAPWQKQVYGKKYQPGRVGQLNEKVQAGREREKELKTKSRELKGKLGTADDSTKTAIEKHLASLEKRQSTVTESLGGAKASRDKFLSMRDKALESIVAQAKTNPGQLSKARKRLISKKLKRKKVPASANGGTTAP
jgi:hypothetical protein